MQLEGAKVIVTGGVHGLGRSMVELLLTKGAHVSIFDIDIDTKVPGVHCIVECDVSDPREVFRATEVYYMRSGSPDVLINNAGILYSCPLIRITPNGIREHDIGLWQRVLDVNLSSVFYMTSRVVEQMITTRTKGVIVNISSVSAAGNAGQSAYSAAKAGVNALTAVWAKELSPIGIRVVAIALGFCDTKSAHRALSDTSLNEIVQKVPLRRLGRSEEIARGVVAVIENDFFNGKVIELDGGLVV